MRHIRIAVCAILSCAVVFGQAATGTISGVVTDPAGAAIANAPVEVRNIQTNIPYPTVTTDTGAYSVLQLPPGPYSVTVSAAGFKKLTRTGLTVSAGQTLPLDLMLEVGSAAESVTVSAEATLLKTETGDVAHNITLEQLDDLPILGIGTANAGSIGIRNPYNSVVFLPGVNYAPNFAMIVNGAPTNTAAYRLEGMDFTNHVTPPNNFAIQMNQPSPDAVQEMAIQTSNYAPEFGQAGGGLFNITMKSGSNGFHGSAYEYYVNEFLNAGYPFSFNSGTLANPSGGKYTPSNRRNDWGGTVGGPVWIPKVYNGKDRTFFFFSYERYKEDQALTFPDTLPNAQYQAGNFGAISPNGGAAFNPNLGVPSGPIARDAAGNPVYANELFDPLSRSTVGGVGVSQPFANNVIPQIRFSPVATAIQGLLPPLSNGNLYNNYSGYNLGERITDVPSVKVDQLLGPRNKLSFFYQHTNTDVQYSTPNGNADGLPALLTGARGSIPIGGPTWRLNYDYTVTPTLLAHFGVGYSMIYFYDDGPYTKSGKTVDCAAMLQLQGCEGSFNFPTIVAGNVTSPVQLGGMLQLGNALAHAHTHVERPASNANLTWVRGNHTYKAGAEVWWQAFIQNPPTGVGLNFATLSVPGNPNSSSGSVTNAGATGVPAPLTITGGYTPGFPYANFLLGDVTSATQYAPVDSRMFKSQWGLFIQDSWKVTRKLTVDYGLRWDYASFPAEEYGRSANLGFNVPNPAAGGRLGAPIFQATCNCTFGSAYPYALGPRLGVAYQIDAKTVFRGGWGFAYAPPNDLTLQNTANITNTPSGVSAYMPLNTAGTIPQPVWPNFDPGQTPARGQITSGFLSYIDRQAARPPRQNQWSIGLQREITPNFVMEASYVGNRGVWWTGPLGYVNQVSPQAFAAYGLSPYTNATDNLLLGQSLSSAQVVGRVGNILPYPGYATTNTLLNALRPFPQFSTITVSNSPTGDTWYDSLQVKGTKRLSHGLQVNGTFTWSKALVNVRPNLFVSSYRSLQSTDQPFLFNANVVYTTQKYFNKRLAAALTQDWAIGAFLQYGSGFPLTPPTATNTNFLGSSQYFRDPSQPLYLKDLNCGCINPYNDVVLNPKAWVNPASGTFGPAVGTYYGDFRTARHPQENFNFSRTFRIKEGVGLQLRAEFVNIFNRTELGNPSTVAPGAAPSKLSGLYSGGFGVVNLTLPGPRNFPSTTQNLVSGQLWEMPRTGTLIARVTF